MAYIITYDLNRPGQNYDELIKAIKTYHWCKIAESAWVVTTTKKAEQIRDHLLSNIDSNDKIFVCKLFREAAWNGEPNDVTKWLQDNL